MVQSRRLFLLFLAAAMLLSACGGGSSRRSSQAALPRPVSILVEVYDPVTNFVWENVSVRIVEADQEWSGSTWINPRVEWFLTDRFGQVFFDEFELARAQVGFRLDNAGRAVLGPERNEDQATVVLEVAAEGFCHGDRRSTAAMEPRRRVRRSAVRMMAGGSCKARQAPASRWSMVGKSLPRSRLDTILLVNDSATLTKVFSNHFQKAGYRVIAVSGVMDAYEAFIRNDIHLILTDYVLRDKDGADVIRTFRSKKSQRSLPIVVFTAMDDASHGTALQGRRSKPGAGQVEWHQPPA
jgi:CheY-like chemotaxis protein